MYLVVHLFEFLSKMDNQFHTYNDDAIVAAQVLDTGLIVLSDPDDGGKVIPHVQFSVQDAEDCARKFILVGKRVIMVEPR